MPPTNAATVASRAGAEAFDWCARHELWLRRRARGPASDPDNPLLRDVGTNVLKSRLRSHRGVARRHYADLLEPEAPVAKVAS